MFVKMWNIMHFIKIIGVFKITKVRLIIHKLPYIKKLCSMVFFIIIMIKIFQKFSSIVCYQKKSLKFTIFTLFYVM